LDLAIGRDPVAAIGVVSQEMQGRHFRLKAELKPEAQIDEAVRGRAAFTRVRRVGISTPKHEDEALALVRRDTACLG